MSRPVTLTASFWDYVEKLPNGCAHWSGARYRGKPAYRSASGSVSPVSFAADLLGLSKGRGRMLHPTCGDSECIAPEHWYAPVVAQPARTLADLTAEDRAEFARRVLREGDKPRALAVRFGLSPDDVSKLMREVLA